MLALKARIIGPMALRVASIASPQILNGANRSGTVSTRQFSIGVPRAAFAKINGQDLYWERIGAGEHVVLGIPGLAGSFKDNILPAFEKMDKEQFTMIGWDPPGYGKSRPPDREILNDELEALRTDGLLALALMEELGYKQFSVVGWSNGGRTGAWLAQLQPERVRKLVMCNSPQFTDDRSVKVAKMFLDLENWTLSQRRRMKKTYEPSYLKKILEDYDKHIMEEFTTQKIAKVFKPGLKKIQAPTLIITGSKDPCVVARHGEEYAKAIPKSRIHVVEDGVHDHLEFLDEFVSATVSFLLEP